MSTESIIEVGQQKPIKLMTKNKEQLINDLVESVTKQLSEVKDGSTIICSTIIITTTKLL